MPRKQKVEEEPTQVPKEERRGRKKKDKVKEKKKPSEYATFVKTNYDKARHLPSKERFKFLSDLWKKTKV